MRKCFRIAAAALPVVLILELSLHTRLTAHTKVAYMKEEVITRSLTVNATKSPLFVLHIGPSKTGTTTVQCAAAQNEHILRRDNFYFLGHDYRRPEWQLHTFFKSCYDIDASKECARKWSELERIVEEHYMQNHDAFLSDEMITAGFKNDQVEYENLWRHLERMLSKWRVRIVFSYRRYHEWIPSKYNQAFNPTEKSKRSNWPDNGGKPTPSFRACLDYMLHKDDFRMPPTLIKRWASHFPNVQVVNMHDHEGEMLEKFFCQAIPEAPAMCKHFHDGKGSDIEIKNPSSKKTLHFDTLAVRAYQKGWVHTNMTRKEVTRAVELHANQLGLSKITDFALDCSNETEELLKQSIEYEREVLPEFFASPRGEIELLSQFAAAVEQHKFCSIDVFRTLKQKEHGWETFFRQLRSTKPGPSGSSEMSKRKKTRKD